MAALSFGTTTTVSVAGTTVKEAGEALAANDLVYYDSATATYKKADKSATANAVVGMALLGVASGEEGVFLNSGSVVKGASLSLTEGTPYYVEGGAFVPLADLGTTGDYITQVAIAVSPTELELNFVATGAQIP